MTIVMLLFVFLFPLVLIKFAEKNKFAKTIGIVTMCYVVGLVVSVLPLDFDKGLIQTIGFVLIPIAISLVLFASKFQVAKSMAGRFFVSFGCLVGAVVIVSSGMFFFLGDTVPQPKNLASMLAGLYTGGTPNVNGIGLATGASTELIGMANLADFIVGGAFLVFLLTIAKPVYAFCLDRKIRDPQFVEKKRVVHEKDTEILQQLNVFASDYGANQMPKNKKECGRLAMAFLLAIVCFAVGAGLSLLFSADENVMLAVGLVSATTFGIAFSFNKKVRETKGVYQSGQYLIYVFSLSIATAMDLSKMIESMLPVLMFFAVAQVSVLVLHMIFCRLFKIDSDTALITGVAGVYGPAFIVPIATKIKNDSVIVPGLICGIIGYAIGTYLGMALFFLL